MCGSCGCCLDYLLANTVPVVCLCVLSCMYAIPVQYSTAQHRMYARTACMHVQAGCRGENVRLPVHACGAATHVCTLTHPIHSRGAWLAASHSPALLEFQQMAVFHFLQQTACCQPRIKADSQPTCGQVTAWVLTCRSPPVCARGGVGVDVDVSE
jgi:hypothetical protein